MLRTNQKGITHILFMVAAVGMVALLVAITSGPFKDKLKEKLADGFFGIHSSQASAPINKKVLLVIYDPILANGQKLHTFYHFNDPLVINQEVMDTINRASGGYVTYQVVETVERNEWPKKLDGFRYNETSYNNCYMLNRSSCHSPDDVDYGQMWSDLTIAGKVSSGQIDAVFVWSFPYSGFDEYAFKIPGDKVPYAMPSNYWLYQGRIKNIPDTNGKSVLVMGWSYEVGADNALHSFGHWVESAMALTVGRGDWRLCSGSSDWDKYTCTNMDITASTPIKEAGCGSVHVPFNGTGGYNYNNTTVQNTICNSWYSYPFASPTRVSMSCTDWDCTQAGYMEWWLLHLPHQDGTTPEHNLRNWWKYIADFDNGVAEAKASEPSPTPIPSPTSLPTPSPTSGPFVKVLTPNGGEKVTIGSHVNIQWQDSGVDSCILNYATSPSGMGTITTITDPNIKSYDWVVNIGNRSPGSVNRVKIDMLCFKSGVGQLHDQSDNPFVVYAPGCSLCNSDVNLNGLVNSADYSVLRACFGKTGSTVLSSGVSCQQTDVNKDGSIDTLDYDCMKQYFGQLCMNPYPYDFWADSAVKRVFASSMQYQSSVSPDAACQSSAINAGLGGTWKAWTSEQTSATAKQNHFNGKYQLVDGTTIANNWNDLIDGNLIRPINKSEYLGLAVGSAWTGSLPSGDATNNNCNNWTSLQSTVNGTVGDPSVTNSNWSNKGTQACSTRAALYCIEQ